jgi:iron complex outermembrane receptor protein
MRLNIIVWTVFLFPLAAASQKITGSIRDAASQAPLQGVNIVYQGNGTTSDANGNFSINNIPEGNYTLTFSYMGYETLQQDVTVPDKNPVYLEITLIKFNVSLGEVVIAGTRNETRVGNIPGRINTITPQRLALVASQSIDEQLQFLPGVQVSRSFGIFSTKSSVTMRGLSGNEQARTLVLVDGIPVNKADGGSVNWNLISTKEIERVEVAKGPGSALYGGNAMGGIINIISAKPVKPLQGGVSIDYGTYNTFTGKVNLQGKIDDQSGTQFYWAANSFYQNSDGYITQSEADQKANPFITKSTVDEKAMNVKLGYGSERFSSEVDFSLYDGVRGTGEKVFQPEGNVTEYLTYQGRLNLKGKTGLLHWNTSLFYLNENYLRVNEFKKDDYTWYNVDSRRVDLGLLSSASFPLGIHLVTAGFDIRDGRVDASDIYYTSTDQVDNRGKMDFYGFYLQDEISATETFKILVGIRYDFANFYDAAFLISNPSAETKFLTTYQFSGKEKVQWGAFSPRLSAQYKPNDKIRVYGSYSRGFRPSVLDDLCRTGRVRGGMKVANPNLKPEYLNNFEAGGDYFPFPQLKLSISIYHSLGTDFLYYVSTGDSIDMGFGDRPIMIRSNISNVKIYGGEFDFTYQPYQWLSVFGNYAYNHATITNYTPLSSNDPVDLEGNFLTDVPQHSSAFGALFTSKIMDVGLTIKYQGEMYVNDQNVYDDIVLSNKYPAWMTMDMKFSRVFFDRIRAQLMVQNLLNEQIYDSKGAVSPGRFITVGLSVKI